MIYMGARMGMTAPEIIAEVKKDGGFHPSKQAVADTVSLAEANGGAAWDGLAESSSGRPRETSGALDKQIVKLVFKMRGRAKVTGSYVQKIIKEARTVSLRTVQRRLVEAGLRWYRRRRKSLLSAEHKVARLAWADWVLLRAQKTLSRWAFTDGTSFYLARSDTELTSKRRAALGSHVWRRADGHDALFEAGLWFTCVQPFNLQNK